MSEAAALEPVPLFPTLQALVDEGGAVSALRCLRDLFPVHHEMESARQLRQRAVLMMAQTADLRADRQSARRDHVELLRMQKDLDSRTSDFIREAQHFADSGRVAPHLLSRVRITAEQAHSELQAASKSKAARDATVSIFVSYRRVDSAEMTGFIAAALKQRFGERGVFMDVDSIPVGVDFRAYIVATLRKCKACLVVIGPDWLNAKGPSGGRRIDDPEDLVRIEVETALRLGVPVAPLMVRGADLPKPHEMPESVRELTNRNGLPIRPHPDFDNDVERLLARLADQLN